MAREIDEIKDAAGAYRRWALEARKKYIELRLKQDPEIRGLYIRAADRVAKELRKLALKTPSSYLRKRQLEELETALRAEADRLTGSLTKAFEQYIEQAVEAGGGYSQAIALDLFKKAGMDITGLRTMFATVNRQAVEACWARTKKGLFLSDRIWEQGEKFRNTMRDMIQEAVATGQDAVKTARMLQQYVRQGAGTLARDYPNMMKRMKGRIPGNISYEALRLARTEMTAAFGEGTLAAAQATPSYIGMKYVLSHNHPVTDICDTITGTDYFGLGHGVYPPGEEPSYPFHPNCRCVAIPVHEQPEKFVERLKKLKENPASEPNIEKWYQDIYIKGQTGGTAVQKPAFLRITKHDKNYDDTSDRQRIENDLKLIPVGHRRILEDVIIQTGYEVSRYDRRNKIIQVGKNPVPGEVIHEVGHAIETKLDLYNDQQFLKVLYRGAESVSFANVILDKESYDIPIIRVEMEKLISEYQGRLYEDVGIFTDDMKVNLLAMREYFSEGYREYIVNPERLKKKDPALFDYIERVIGNE